MIRRLLPLLLLLLLALAACGGGEQTAAIPSGEEPASAAAEITETATEAEPAPKPGRPTAATKALAAKIGTDPKKRPKISKPSGDAPERLVIHDIVEGSGPAVKSGDQVEVHYVGANWSNGSEFGASWERRQGVPFTLGNSEVIPGWDQGIAGMRKGGRRLLVIPPDLGYGAQGQPPDIPPNETLVFVVDLREIG